MNHCNPAAPSLLGTEARTLTRHHAATSLRSTPPSIVGALTGAPNDVRPSPHSTAPISRPDASPVGLAIRGYRCRGRQQVDLFWTGSRADAFDVYRDGQRIATVLATGYTDRLASDGAGSYRYRVCATGTQTRSNEAAVTFRGDV